MAKSPRTPSILGDWRSLEQRRSVLVQVLEADLCAIGLPHALIAPFNAKPQQYFAEQKFAS